MGAWKRGVVSNGIEVGIVVDPLLVCEAGAGGVLQALNCTVRLPCERVETGNVVKHGRGSSLGWKSEGGVRIGVRKCDILPHLAESDMTEDARNTA